MYIGLVVLLEMLFLKCGITYTGPLAGITVIVAIVRGVLNMLGIDIFAFVKELFKTCGSTVLSAFAAGQTFEETRNNFFQAFAALRNRKCKGKSKTAISTIIALCFVLISAPALAANHVVSSSFDALQNAVEVGSEDEDLVEDAKQALDDDELSMSVVEGTTEKDTEQDVEVFEALLDRPLAYRLIIDPVLERTISTTTYQQVFFLSGEFAISDWDSAEVIQEQVRARIGMLVANQKDPNYYGADTPQSAKDDIAKASELEQAIVSSEDLQVVIGLRLDAYDAYPGYRLAKLLRENYALWGDAYHFQGYSKNSAIFYYVESIEWGYETITYQTAAKNLAQNLAIIAERYLKIAQAAPQDSAMHLYARELGNAFLQISADYE